MANTYTKIYIHVVFVVKARQNIISSNWKDDLCKYINGIINNKGQKLMVINGMPDHMHLLISIKPDIALSDLLRDIKANSSRFINEKKWVRGKFEWQNGFGAFSCNPADLEGVIRYINNQEEHHRKKHFREEYIEMLKNNSVEYKSEYLFDDV